MPSSTFFCRLLQLHLAQLGDDCSGLLAGGLFALLSVNRLEHLCHMLGLGTGHDRKTRSCKSAPYSAGISRQERPRPQPPASPGDLSPTMSFTPSRPAALEPLEKSRPSWPCPPSCPPQRPELLDNRPHSPRSPPVWPRFRTLLPSSGADRCIHVDIRVLSLPAKDDLRQSSMWTYALLVQFADRGR